MLVKMSFCQTCVVPNYMKDYKEAPCPPSWDYDLLWDGARDNRLHNDAIDQIVEMCNVTEDIPVLLPSPSTQELICDSACIVLIITLSIVLLFSMLVASWCIYYIKKMPNNRQSISEMDETSYTNIQDFNSSFKERDNPAYLADVQELQET